jgi:hypothetical protein
MSEPVTSLYNAAIIGIIARELIEMVILIFSHVGSVMRSKLTWERKKYYTKGLAGGYLAGCTIGIIVSLAVGFR